ncbi:transporter substrate-binding domain-containing protein [Clostridium diolis]|uniref:Amino acid ABC transporter substrate-binding protein n=1 Tax=Clostridium diolis TaxID=223919 RepID=A0AAV3W3I7_9CLOT|nr:transporter substrate-binding domain-containing protein [Clostridium diolis]QES74580.1 transporter substrate-binding domain-containing protein [Clostridium diolis]GEA32942.1 amino acid ABC transporter substrate-binding protein [Clostridium diolis]
MKKFTRIMGLITILIISTTLLSCKKQVSNESNQSSEKVKKIVVAVSGSPKPYNYVNESGELDGYEIAILKEIDRRLPDVELEFQKTDFAGLFAGLDSNRYQVVANNMTKKPEREEKYLFGDTSYVKNHTIIAVRENETNIKTIDDLQGKNVPGSSSGNATTLYLEKYNQDHKDKPINIIYTEGDYSATLQDLQNGRFDAYVVAETYVDTASKALNLNFKRLPIANEEEVQQSKAYFMFRKDQEELKKEFDGVLNDLIAEGKLSELSIKYFGKDYSK